MAPYVPRPPLVINCLDDKPWFPIGTRGQGYCVIAALPLPSKTYSEYTPLPQTLRCTVDKFSKTDKHQLGHTCNVLITSVQFFFGNVSLVYLHDDGFLYICALWNPRLFLICTQEQFQTDVDFSKAHISAQRPLCHLVYFSTLQPAFQPSAVLCITFMCHSCFNQYRHQQHVVILNLIMIYNAL